MKTKISGLTILVRSSAFVFIWWILTDGSLKSWLIGGPAVVVALIVSIALIPPIRFVWLAFFKFIPFFVVRSLIGAADVAWRAFSPALPISPELFEYPMKLRLLPAQVFMLNVVSLLPGTLSASLDGHVLKLHVLDKHKEFLPELEAVERNVARIFALSLKAPE